MLSFLKRIYWSKENGLILVTQEGEVLVQGFKQTSKNYPNMWADAFAHIKLPKEKVLKVLILGLGGGGILPSLWTTYPRAHMTAIEHDPKMIEIAKELNSEQPFPFPRIIQGDAFETLTDVEEIFDIIIVDLFRGITPAKQLQYEKFWTLLHTRLEPHGVGVINMAATPSLFELPRKLFTHSYTWRHEPNTLGIFWD